MIKRVLYIAGASRTGSTLLDRLLGSYEGHVSVGEINYFWGRGLLQGWACGCGEPVPQCAFWERVMRETLGPISQEEAAWLAGMARSLSRARALPLLRFEPTRRWLLTRAAPYLDRLARLYHSIGEAAEVEGIVDSSKFPGYAMLLDALPGIEVYVIHLLRDPRAVVYSWTRERMGSGPGGREPMPRYGTLRTSALWLRSNLATNALAPHFSGRFLRVRYEELASTPEVWVDRIWEFVGAKPAGSPFRSSHEVDFPQAHTVSGNPLRFETGRVQIRRDDAWKEAMSPGARSAVIALTAWLARAYGY